MKPFLEEAIDHILSSKKTLENIKLIFPSKRAGTFAKYYILQKTNHTYFAPEILSIEEFIKNVSGLDYASETELLFLFYEHYSSLTEADKTDTFDDFLNWAPTVLQDFNEVDRHLVDAKEIFSYLSSIQDINHWYLNDIKTNLQEKYIAFWKKLYDYYKVFTQNLLNNNIGYQGLVYRKAAENIRDYAASQPNKSHFFIGFNALNKAEEHIFTYLLDNDKADIFFDIDSHFYNNTIHEAGLFIKKHTTSWNYFKNNPVKWLTKNYTTQPKNIKIIGCPKSTSQANYIGNIIRNEELNLTQTAIVLGNESTLSATLNAIPESITHVNITMGYPLKDTPEAVFIDLLFELQLQKKQRGWYYKNILNVLNHSAFSLLQKKESNNKWNDLVTKINSENLVFIKKEQIETIISSPLTSLLFYEATPENFLKNSKQLILQLKEAYYNTNNPIALEALYRIYELFNQLEQYICPNNHNMRLQTLYKLYKELLQKASLDFQGEPLDGLQIMGVLESRNLDFKNVIISGVNEGLLPAGKSYNSFIPFDVKVAYNLPTYKEKDAVYGYHFYRLLQRAENIYLIYNTYPDSLEGGEKSRFIMQILTDNLPNHNIQEVIASPKINQNAKTPITIFKTPELITKLQEIAQNKGFSPSSLTNYIRNPIDFYFKTVLGIKEADEVEESVAANTLGSIIHDTLEKIYTPYINQKLNPDIIALLLKTYPNVLEAEFQEKNFSKDNSTGKNQIIYNVADHYIKRFLEGELNDLKKGNDIIILALEKSLAIELNIDGLEIPVKLKGKVDRIDVRNSITRIVDYKTGKAEAKNLKIKDWMLLNEDHNKSIGYQVLTYSYLGANNGLVSLPVEAGVISFKNLKQGFISFNDENTKSSLITEQTLAAYQEQLFNLIREILNPDIPFKEKKVK